MRRALLSFAIAAMVITFTSPASAQPIWTAVANTGTVDETATGIYSFITDNAAGTPALRYLPASSSLNRIIARYNVTNPAEDDLTPPWATMQMGFTDTGGTGQVTATLYRVTPCTATAQAICTIPSFDNATPTCNTCSITAGFDFNQYLYFVEVTLTRTSANANPMVHTLRIY